MFVLRELNGMETNALPAQEEKDGNHLLAAFAQLAHFSQDLDAKELMNLDVL